MSESDHSSALDAQRARLARWLDERRLDLALRAAGAPAAAEAPVSAAQPTPAACRVRPPPRRKVGAGSILLLPPLPDTQAEQRPVYVVVLAGEAGGPWLIVPFGRYAEPAVTGEWATGLRTPALRVLCLWNHRRVVNARLARAWAAGRLAPAKRRRAWAVFGRLQLGLSEPGPDDGDLGPPLRHPEDPRHEYLAEEAGLLDELLQAAAGDVVDAPAARPSASAPVTAYPLPASEQRLAAEDHARYLAPRRARPPRKAGQRPGDAG